MDTDTDLLSNVICGVWWRSGWWFEPNCGSTGNLNVPYNPVPQYGNLAGILWPGTARSARMRSTLMMIRPLGYSCKVSIMHSESKFFSCVLHFSQRRNSSNVAEIAKSTIERLFCSVILHRNRIRVPRSLVEKALGHSTIYFERKR